MIDFVKVYYRDKDLLENYVESEEEVFKEVNKTLELRSGEIRYPLKTKYSLMDVAVSEKSGYVQNSIHKFFDKNSGNKGENHSDFKYSEIIQTINMLQNVILDFEKTRITNLEFGLNINVPIPAEQIIMENVLMHKYGTHNNLREYNGKGCLKQFDHSNYVIKIYDKAKQYKLKDNLLRFEIRFTKSKLLNQLEVFNINSLKNKQVLEKLMTYLLNRFDELQIVDAIPLDTTWTDSKIEFYHRGVSSAYWQHIRTKSYSTISRRKLKWNIFLEEHNLLKTKSHLRSNLVQKFKYLIQN